MVSVRLMHYPTNGFFVAFKKRIHACDLAQTPVLLLAFYEAHFCCLAEEHLRLLRRGQNCCVAMGKTATSHEELRYFSFQTHSYICNVAKKKLLVAFERRCYICYKTRKTDFVLCFLRREKKACLALEKCVCACYVARKTVFRLF